MCAGYRFGELRRFVAESVDAYSLLLDVAPLGVTLVTLISIQIYLIRGIENQPKLATYLQLFPKVQFPFRKNEQAVGDCGLVWTVDAGSCEKEHSEPLKQLPERKNLRTVKEKDSEDVR